jgi:hypothetical protein
MERVEEEAIELDVRARISGSIGRVVRYAGR